MVKISNIFLVDPQTGLEYTYDFLLEKLNSTKDISDYILEQDNFNILFNIVLSIIADKPITLLDNDFSYSELEELGITKDEINRKSNAEVDEIKSVRELYERIRTAENWQIGLYTSGTTGLPKKVNHSFQSITKGVVTSEKHKNDIWGFAYNPTHIAGLQVFFQAFLNQNPIINLFGLERDKTYKLIDAYQITHLSATPTFFRLLRPLKDEYKSVIRVTSGGEKFDSKLINDLQRGFPNAEIRNIYASTEAGTLFISKGDTFSIKEEYSDRIKIEENELYLHKSLLGESESFQLKNDWYNTGDEVEIISENPLQFKFVKRKNEMINVGGYKVNPEEVEEYLNSHAFITNSRVYAKANSVLGNILCADVILYNELKEKDLRAYLSDKIQDFKIPRIIKFVDNIETTRSGKVKRNV